MKKLSDFVGLCLLTSLLLTSYGCKKDEPTAEPVNGKGLKHNTLAALEKVRETDIDEDVLNLPASFSFDGPPIQSQGNTNKCVSFSSAYYIIGLYNGLTSASTDISNAGSVEFSHATFKKINADDCADGAFLFDEGNIKGMAEILQTTGTPSWGSLPFVDSKACAVTTASNTTEAAKNKISGYARLDKTEFNDLQELKSWMYAGFPLWFAVDVEDNFGDLGNGDIWTKNSGTGSGHAMTLVGWDDAKKAFKIANSWGKNWGSNGYGWVSYDHFFTLINKVPEIGVLYPNAAQKAVFNKLSPGSCGRAGWGDIYIDNKRAEEIAVVMEGANNYINDDASNIDASEGQFFSTIPKGTVKIKVYNATKTTLIKEYSAVVTECNEVVVTVQ
jgi:hypothetical protein